MHFGHWIVETHELGFSVGTSALRLKIVDRSTIMFELKFLLDSLLYSVPEHRKPTFEVQLNWSLLLESSLVHRASISSHFKALFD